MELRKYTVPVKLAKFGHSQWRSQRGADGATAPPLETMTM